MDVWIKIPERADAREHRIARVTMPRYDGPEHPSMQVCLGGVSLRASRHLVDDLLRRCHAYRQSHALRVAPRRYNALRVLRGSLHCL